ncbi:tetratricopeptide repeat protein [bacterium]|nr:tetratricopeptide repeat protein [bacterium]
MKYKEKNSRHPGLRPGIRLLIIMTALMIPAVAFYGRDNCDGDKMSKETPDRPGPALDAARALVIAEDFGRAVSAYAVLVRKDSSNVLLNAEYAYALALNGIYDGALARLDRIWRPGANTAVVDFFTSQVFALMGYETLAVEVGKKIEAGSVPDWIASDASDLLLKYSDRNPSDNMTEGGDVVTDFRRANRLAAQNYNLMAVAMFEGIITAYPGEYLPYVGSSIALEKAGLDEQAVAAVEKALAILGDGPENQETRQVLQNRLTEMKMRTVSGGRNAVAAAAAKKGSETSGRRMLAYAGGMISPSYLSLNGRFGTFISGSGSLSADLGITRSGGAMSLNLGAMNYFRQRIFAGGYGLNLGFGGGSTAVNVKVSVGLSIMNKNSRASWDIFLDGQQPIAPKGATTTVGLSIGRSVYFGSR